jgi:magnesium transporter
MRDNVSADWIAHGLLDSIVDAFFPLISYIDEEVDIIDSLVADPSTDPRAPFKKPTAAESLAADYLANIPANEEHIELQDRKDYLNSPPSSGGSPNSLGMKNSGVLERVRKSVTSPFNPIARWCSRKQMPVRQRLHHASLLVSTSTPMLYARFFARRTGTVLGLYGKKQRKKQILPDPIFDRREMLRRMTEMRRLVTGMTRLLGFKHQVVSRLKRRAGNEGGEVGAYIGDVHGEC